MAQPLVSIVLPTWNGEEDLRHLLPRLRSQELRGEFEIRAVDSSSTDGTRALLAEAGAHVTTIDKSEFRHGRTRNLAAADATGRILVFLSQDTEPADDRFLQTLVDAFEDERVAGATSRVLPHPDDDSLTRRTVLNLPEASEEPVLRDLDRVDGLWNLAPEERAAYLRFNNVSSAIRADVFRRTSFPDIAFGEDFAWAARVLTAGWRIRYVPGARVYHAHRYSPRKAFERYRVDAAFHRQVHGFQLRPTLTSALRGFLYEVRADLGYVRRTRARDWLSASLRSPLLRGAQLAGQYCGSHGLVGGPALEATGRMR